MSVYKKIIQFLRLKDSAWQAIGAIIGLIALIVSTLVAYDIYTRSNPVAHMTVRELYNFNPFSFSETMQERLTLLIDGREVESVRVYYYSISNSGRNPIRPSDFVKPIQVSVDKPWQLLAVDTDWSWPSDLEVKWNEVLTNTFEIEPLLLNPDDRFDVAFFLTNPQEDPDSSEPPEPPEVKWSTRIVNLPSLETRHRGEAPFQRSPFGVLNLGISHSGWGLFWLAGLSALFFVVGIWIGIRNKHLVQLSSKQLFLSLAIMMLSFSTSEILVDYFVNRNYSQWPGIWLFLTLHILLLLYLTWPSIWEHLSQGISSANRREPDTPDES